MISDIFEMISSLFGFGLDSDELNPGQILARSLAIYIVTLIFVKLGSRRLFGKASLFDAIVAIMLGSIMSRGAIGASPLLQTITAAGALIATHWILASIALRFSKFGPLIKGDPVLLIKDGEIQKDEMKRSHISRHDLEEALRLAVNHEDPKKVKSAYLERNGKISVIPYTKEPRIIEATCDGGIHRIRISLE